MLTLFQRIHIYRNQNDIQSEWNQLNHKQWSDTTTAAAFHFKLFDDCGAGGHKCFNHFKISSCVNLIWFSTAGVERAFSIYNIVKNKLRNRLSIEMLQSLMIITFTPFPKSLQLYNVNMHQTLKLNAKSGLKQFINSIKQYPWIGTKNKVF